MTAAEGAEKVTLNPREVFYQSAINPAFAEKVELDAKQINTDKKTGNDKLWTKKLTVTQIDPISAEWLMFILYGIKDSMSNPIKQVEHALDQASKLCVGKGYALMVDVLNCSRADWLAQGLPLRVHEIVHKAFAKSA